jgi:hypothetical protein
MVATIDYDSDYKTEKRTACPHIEQVVLDFCEKIVKFRWIFGLSGCHA